MHVVISFKTSMFDLSKEHENTINPIHGESLLNWLKVAVDSDIEFSEPFTEDWGWCSNILWKGRQYMLGASVYFEEGDDPQSELEWIFQIDKDRTLIEKLFGKEKIDNSDECVMFFKSKLLEEPQIHSVEFE